jgi:hypothetical protein
MGFWLKIHTNPYETDYFRIHLTAKKKKKQVIKQMAILTFCLGAFEHSNYYLLTI